ncbi:hypothetical protein TNCV_571881 [Trichonephila clavipes]|nr:hypothetical protein TNCV_571881 [Trichonephila clavipes]
MVILSLRSLMAISKQPSSSRSVESWLSHSNQHRRILASFWPKWQAIQLHLLFQMMASRTGQKSPRHTPRGITTWRHGAAPLREKGDTEDVSSDLDNGG